MDFTSIRIVRAFVNNINVLTNIILNKVNQKI